MKYYGKSKIKKIEERQVEYLRCDKCKSKIIDNYYDVTTGHYDWGNDSIDSIEHFEICEKCIVEFTKKYLKDADGTEYIDIERKYFIANSNRYGDYDKYEDKLVENDTN